MRKQAQARARSAAGVALAAARGASPAELIQAALAALRERAGADRLGVWLAETPGDDSCRGEVRDAARAIPPREWSRLSLETVFPQGARGTGRSFAPEVFSPSRREPRSGPALAPLAGPDKITAGLRHVLWAPVQGPGGWRGVVLAGWKNQEETPPRDAVEEIAAELALALNYREAEAAAGARARELDFVRKVLAGGARDAYADLREVLRRGAHEAGVDFLAAGWRAGEGQETPALIWTAEEESLLPQIESEPLRGLWRDAFETGRVTAAGPLADFPGNACEKWMALPLDAGGARLGVLLAGVRRGHGGALAAQILSRGNDGELAVARAARLPRAEKLAALGQMVSGIAHELSNPLTSILGYAQRLLLREEFARSEEVRKIHDEAGRAARMLRQLLGTGRENGLDRRQVSLNQIVLRSLELRRAVLPEQRVRLETSLDPQAPLLAADPDRLQQVVLNLVANAQQAIEQGPGEGRGVIRVTTRCGADGRLRLEVSDDGPGISPELLERIFDPFFTTKPASAGTGLGLSIVREIVREHGGQIQAANQPGGGAVFTVELPLLEPEGAAAPLRLRKRPERAAPVEAARKLEALPGGRRAPGARVLVVEDEPTVAQLIADVLREEGMHVEVLLDAGDALGRAARRSFDLIICDLRMPGLDGRHFYQALERQGSPLCERFLFVTGDALSASTMDFLKRNRLACVHKPFRVEELTRPRWARVPIRPGPACNCAWPLLPMRPGAWPGTKIPA
ncbi:MAG: response regulator [Acidobacteriia bacterium]|nr:response regulator [Terriglobia bacterium]